MTSLCNLGAGGCRPSLLQSLQVRAFERLVALNVASGDLRFTLIALVSAALTAAANAWLENILRRALQGARFAASVTAADTMVAAGRR